MKAIHKVAADFRIKLAQIQVREFNMGPDDEPNLENMVKNIEVLIRAFNQTQAQGSVPGQISSLLRQLQQVGINVTL